MIILAYIILVTLARWVEASKMGLNGWELYVPIYNFLKIGELVGFKKKTIIIMILICCIPFINIITCWISLIYFIVLGVKYATLLQSTYGGSFWGHFLLYSIYTVVLELKNAPNENDAASQLVNRLLNAKNKPIFKTSDNESPMFDIESFPEF